MAAIIKKATTGSQLSKIDLLSTDANVVRKLNDSGYLNEITALENLKGFESFDASDAALKLKQRTIVTGGTDSGI